MKTFNLLFPILFLILVTACQEKSAEVSAVELVDTVAVAASESADMETTTYKDKAESSSNDDNLQPPPPPKVDAVAKISPKIIRNANLQFESQDLEKTYQSIWLNCKKKQCHYSKRRRKQ